jgi:DNA-directed RNA polymerase
VNLTKADATFDIYTHVANMVREQLVAANDVDAMWWHNRLDRAMVKMPVMTFAYAVTEYGVTEHILDECKRRYGWEDGLAKKARDLARIIRQVCEELLPRPAAAMRYICELTDYCTERGKPLRWTSPTGVPIANRHYKPNTRDVEMPLRGVRVKYRVADGWSSDIIEDEARNAAAANFVHSRDASHLIRSVNTAVGEGITNVVCVHDCFGTTAPHSHHFQQIIRREMVLMYVGALFPDPRRPSLGHNPLAQLRAWNAGEDFPPPPEQGTLDPTEVGYAEYTFK